MVALSHLLELPRLGLRLIQSGAGDPEISWVSNTELLDLGAYLEGGEIILTTGLALGADDPRWLDFVAGLNRARVAAIGFGVGVNHERVPPPLVRAASTYRVALFEVPLPVPFIAVSKALAGLLRADELGAAREALYAQQRLFEGARGDQHPAEILASLAQATGKHLALLTSDGATIASTAGFAAARTTAQDPLTIDRTRDVPPETLEFIDLDAAGSARLALTGGAPLTPEGRSIVAAGAMVLGLALRGDRADAERERSRWELAAGAALTGAPLAAAIALLAPESPVPSRVRVLALQGSAEDLAAWRREPRSGLDRLIARDADAAPTPGVERAWQIVADDAHAPPAALERAAHHNLDVVVGRAADIEQSRLSRRSAAARLSALSPTAPLYEAPRVPSVIWADRDTPLLEALLEMREARVAPDPTTGGAAAPSREARGGEPLTLPVLRALSRSRLQPPNHPSGGVSLQPGERELLRDTLYAVFAADGQRGPAAAALGVHRNTLRDRISRIERVTGRSLRDPDDRAELWFALRLEDADAD